MIIYQKIRRRSSWFFILQRDHESIFVSMYLSNNTDQIDKYIESIVLMI